MARLLVTLMVLALPLCACASDKDPAKKAAIEEIERRHAEELQRMGGGGGSGM